MEGILPTTITWKIINIFQVKTDRVTTGWSVKGNSLVVHLRLSQVDKFMFLSKIEIEKFSRNVISAPR